jgi:SPP1 family predicted phage head-tail adaptor
MIIAYKLRHRIDIQSLEHQIDSDTGARLDVWTTFVAKEPAAIAPLSGREFIAAQAIQSGVSTRITIRKRDGIVPSMRILHNDTIYNILSVLPDPTLERHLTILCDSGFNDG